MGKRREEHSSNQRSDSSLSLAKPTRAWVAQLQEFVVRQKETLPKLWIKDFISCSTHPSSVKHSSSVSSSTDSNWCIRSFVQSWVKNQKPISLQKHTALQTIGTNLFLLNGLALFLKANREDYWSTIPF